MIKYAGNLRTHLIILLLAGGVISAKAATITSLSQNSGTIGRYEKFEVTFTLSQTYANPFDPCIIDVAVTFNEPGGTTATIPAFYYQAYNTSQSNPEHYTTTSGSPCWKARFAPSKTGTHSFDISIKDSSGWIVYTNRGSFDCQESGKKGFIRVNQNDRAYLSYDNGETVLNIGQNIGWNVGGVYGWNDYLTKMHNAGENWLRLWLCRYGSDGGVLLEWQNGSYGGYFQGAGRPSMQTSQRLDKYIEIAEQNEIAIQLCLQHHGQFSTTTNPDWNENPYNELAGGFLNDPGKYFTDANAIRLTKNKYRYTVARWGYSPAIFAWELFNEVQYTNGWRNDQASVVNWHNEMASYIRSIDPFNHPITTSSHGSGFENIWNLADINLVQVHYYGTDTINTFEQTAFGLADYNKPVIMAEFGAGGDAETNIADLPEPYRTQMQEALMLHDGIWSSFHVKSSGHLWWWDCYIDPYNLYPEFTALAVYAEGEDLAEHNLTRAQRAVSGNQAYYASPALNDFWAISDQNVFYLQGDYFPGMENLSKWLHGTSKDQNGVRSDPNFHLNMPGAGFLKIQVESTANWCENSIRVLVNSAEVFSATYPNDFNNFTITVPLSAGQQSVHIENTGQDWFHVSNYSFVPDNISLLDSTGLSGSDRAYIWIYDVNSQYGKIANGVFENEPVIVKGLDDGRYEVEVYATRGTGGVIDSGRVNSVSGVLTYTLPDFEKDIAVKVRPCVVGLEDLAAFCAQWLETGMDLDGDGGSPDFFDFNILGNYWQSECPTDWPV